MTRDGRSSKKSTLEVEDPFLDPERRERHEKAARIVKDATTWENLPKQIAKVIREIPIEFDDDDEAGRREFIEGWFYWPFIDLESRAREAAAVSVRNVTDYRKHLLLLEIHILGLAIQHLRASMKAAITKEFYSDGGSEGGLPRPSLEKRESAPAQCACGAVAVQWRKDTPVCANPECLTKASFGGK